MIKWMLEEYKNETEQEIFSIKNHSLEVNGDDDDIRREIKRFIAYALSLPYVIKVEIIRLSINTEDKDSDFYR